MRTTEKLLQSRGGIGWVGGQDLRCVNQQTGAEAGTYQSFSGLLSILFSTNQLFQEHLFKLVLLKLPASFRTISNQITSHLFKHSNQIYVLMTPPNM